jgi:hypothetical protein
MEEGVEIMSINHDIKQERTISVQGRVDVIKLAEVFASLEMNNYNVRTMSLLVSYCLEITHTALEQNGLLDKKIEGDERIKQAFHLLIDNGIMTRHMADRNKTKIESAWKLENIRKEGGIPSIEAPVDYNKLHNTHSSSVPEQVSKKSKGQELLDLAAELEAKDLIEKSKAPIEHRQKYNVDENGAIIPKHAITPKLECPVPATDIPDEAATEKPDFKKQGLAKYQAWKLEQQRKKFEEKQARTSKGASDIPRQKTDEEIQADFDRIANKDKELMAALDAGPPPVN